MGRMLTIHISRHEQRIGGKKKIIYSSEAQAPAEGSKIHTGFPGNVTIHLEREELEFYYSNPHREIHHKQRPGKATNTEENKEQVSDAKKSCSQWKREKFGMGVGRPSWTGKGQPMDQMTFYFSFNWFL